MKKLAIFLINFYKGFSFLLFPGGACRYSPTCSEYTKQSIIRLGLSKGLIAGIRRLASCL